MRGDYCISGVFIVEWGGGSGCAFLVGFGLVDLADASELGILGGLALMGNPVPWISELN